MNTKLISAFLVLAVASLACGSNINMPKIPTPGPEVTDEITVPTPKTDEVSLRLSFGAGEMSLAPGASQLVEGTATYNYAAFKPEVNVDGGNVEIKMSEIKSLPAFDKLKNKWDFKLGDTPMDLTIELARTMEPLNLADFPSTTLPSKTAQRMWSLLSLNPISWRCPHSSMRQVLRISK